MKYGYYDLDVNPPSFDFVQFMQYALHAGAEKVVFKRGKNGNKKAFGDTEDERFESIILPLVKLYGVGHEFVDKKPQEPPCYPLNLSSHAHDMNMTLLPPRPYPVKPSQEALERANDIFKGKRPIVVSLRRMTTTYHHGRNSGPDWERWAADHEAFIVEDYDQKKIPVDDRVAYYELASLNMGINSGLMALNILSLRPYLCLKMVNESYKVTSTKYLKSIGFQVGSVMPWADRTQKIIWNDKDDYQTIESEYQKYMKDQ